MDTNRPVVIIEDDADDQEFFKLAFSELNYPNKLIFFSDGEEALEFLTRTEIVPFIILSDINMPKLDGFELRKKLKTDAQLGIKCIPYLFFSTARNQQMVIDAYSLSVQGFFIKQAELSELKKSLTVIMDYWTRCASPNNLNAPLKR